MKKLLLVFLILAVGILPLVGCEGFSSGGSGLDTPTPTPAPVPAPEPEFPIPKVDNNSEEVETILPGKPPPDEMTWISPGKVMVGNFYPGARAEYPLTIHNGNDTRTEFTVYYRYPDHVDQDSYKVVKTEEECPPYYILEDSGCYIDETDAGEKPEGVKEWICPTLPDEEADDELHALEYACEIFPSYITVVDTSGEKSEVENFGCFGEPEKHYLVPEMQDWVIVVDPTPVLMPRETKEILIILDMPEGMGHPPKWEFWIGVMDTTQTGMVQTELACRWLVTMR